VISDWGLGIGDWWRVVSAWRLAGLYVGLSAGAMDVPPAADDFRMYRTFVGLQASDFVGYTAPLLWIEVKGRDG
jgi:hypothetical protein